MKLRIPEFEIPDVEAPGMDREALGELARQALETGQVLKLPDSVERPRVAIEALRYPSTGVETDEAARRIADAVWRAKGAGRFDGSLLGALEAEWDTGRARFRCAQIRYRDYLATDDILKAHPDVSPPLAIGVHAILSCEAKLVCVRLKGGELGLPGGAVDAADALAGGEDAFAHALVREVAEETGIVVPHTALRTHGLYLGGTPTHLLLLFAASIGSRQAAEAIAGRHDAAGEGILGTELIAVSELIGRAGETSLVLRLALQSWAPSATGEPGRSFSDGLEVR